MLSEVRKRTQHVVTSFIDHENKRNVGICWAKNLTGLNWTQHVPTSWNIARHGVQTNATCCVQHVAFVCTGLLRALRGCLPKSGTVVVGFETSILFIFCAMKGIHVQVTKWVLVCENNLKCESTQRFKFWLSRYPGRPGSRVILGQL